MAKKIESLEKDTTQRVKRIPVVIETPISGSSKRWDVWDAELEGDKLSPEDIIRDMVTTAELPEGVYTISVIGDIVVKAGARLQIRQVDMTDPERFATKVGALKLPDGKYQFKSYG